MALVVWQSFGTSWCGTRLSRAYGYSSHGFFWMSQWLTHEHDGNKGAFLLSVTAWIALSLSYFMPACELLPRGRILSQHHVQRMPAFVFSAFELCRSRAS